jgi:hypothetical protein
MAMQESVCTDCGAINRVDAPACWRCLEAMPDAASSAPAPQPQRTTA